MECLSQKQTIWSNLFGPFALGLVVLLTACMPKIEEEEALTNVSLDAYSITGVGSSSRVVISGKCPISTYLLRILIGSTEEYSVNTSSVSSADYGSGVPVAACTHGNLRIEYSPPSPDNPRDVDFGVKARGADGKSSDKWVRIHVKYVPRAGAVPGFAITFAGGTSSSTSSVMYAAGGESSSASPNGVKAGNVLSSAVQFLYNGLYGVLFKGPADAD